jgi:predicted transcriptional regulator
VLTIRVTPETHRRLTRAARATRRTRSETARAILETALAGTAVVDPVAEARRQSKLASDQPDEHSVLEFITTAADLKGWR